MANIKFREGSYVLFKTGRGNIEVPIMKTGEEWTFRDGTSYQIQFYVSEGYTLSVYNSSSVRTKLTIPQSSSTIYYYSGINRVYPGIEDETQVTDTLLNDVGDFLYYLRIALDTTGFSNNNYTGWVGPPSEWPIYGNMAKVKLQAVIASKEGGVPIVRDLSRSAGYGNINYKVGNYAYGAMGMIVVVDSIGQCLPMATYWPNDITVLRPGGGVFKQTSDSVITKLPQENEWGKIANLGSYGSFPQTYSGSYIPYAYSNVVDRWFTGAAQGIYGPGVPVDPDQPVAPDPIPGGDSDNPYNPNPDKPGGNPGGSNPTDQIRAPSLNRLFSIYSMDGANLTALAKWMWTPDIFDQLARVFQEPIDLFLGLYYSPFTPVVGAPGGITFGNLLATNVTARPVDSFQKEFSFTANSPLNPIMVDDEGNYLESYLDYAPYTEVQLFLPFCGTHKLDTDLVMGKTVKTLYRVDVITGACSVHVIVDENEIMYASGNCYTEMPVTSLNWGEFTRSVIGLAAQTAATFAGGGGIAAGARGVSKLNMTTTPSTGRQLSNAFYNQELMGGSAMAAQNSIDAVLSSKPSVSISGSASSSLGHLMPQRPFMLIKRPDPWVTANQQTFQGFPSHMEFRLSDVKGFAIIEDIHLAISDATSAELGEIENLLKAGVIL